MNVLNKKLSKKEIRELLPCGEGYRYYLTLPQITVKQLLVVMFAKRFEWGLWFSLKMMSKAGLKDFEIFAFSICGIKKTVKTKKSFAFCYAIGRFLVSYFSQCNKSKQEFIRRRIIIKCKKNVEKFPI